MATVYIKWDDDSVSEFSNLSESLVEELLADIPLGTSDNTYEPDEKVVING